jgi:ubiquinone/menaquinone biosynthesis C-methylase UbiE
MRVNKSVELRKYYDTEFFDFECSRGYLEDIFTLSRLRAVADVLPERLHRKPWLEVGCGFGYGLKRLCSNDAYPCVGLDLSMRFLTEARRVAIPSDSRSFCQGDVLSLPFRSASFEGVLALEVIEHTLDVPRALDEICRVARDYVILSFPTDYDWLYTRLGLAENPYIGISFDEALHRHVGHIAVPTLQSVIERLVCNKFAVEALRSLYSVVPPPFKLGFHYPDLRKPWRALYRVAVAVDHWLSRFPPLRGRGLGNVVVARRIGGLTVDGE